ADQLGIGRGFLGGVQVEAGEAHRGALRGLKPDILPALGRGRVSAWGRGGGGGARGGAGGAPPRGAGGARGGGGGGGGGGRGVARARLPRGAGVPWVRSRAGWADSLGTGSYQAGSRNEAQAALFKEGPRRLPADARAQPGDVRGPVFAAFRRIPRGPVVGHGLSGDIGSPRTGLSEGAPRG